MWGGRGSLLSVCALWQCQGTPSGARARGRHCPAQLSSRKWQQKANYWLQTLGIIFLALKVHISKQYGILSALGTLSNGVFCGFSGVFKKVHVCSREVGYYYALENILKFHSLKLFINTTSRCQFPQSIRNPDLCTNTFNIEVFVLGLRFSTLVYGQGTEFTVSLLGVRNPWPSVAPLHLHRISLFLTLAAPLSCHLYSVFTEPVLNSTEGAAGRSEQAANIYPGRVKAVSSCSDLTYICF